MIDTDKYEGHTPAPWAITNDGIVGVTEPENVTLHVFSGCYSETDAQLIADAPLLLAEVKRKTALADTLWDFIEANIPHLIHQATDVWNKHNEEVIE